MRISITRTLELAALALSVTGLASAQEWIAGTGLPPGTGPRRFAAGLDIGGTLYAIGGTPWQNDGDQDGAVHRLLPGADAWTTASPVSGLGPVVGQAAGVDALGRIIVYGGFVQGEDNEPGSTESYDPVEGPSGNVASRSAPSTAVGHNASARDDQGRLYCIGGGPGPGGPNSGYSDRYDAVADAWQVLAPMPTPTADACAAWDGAGHVLVFGGINAAGTARIANVARLDVSSGGWSDTAMPDMPVALSGARAALGADGLVYVAGGVAGPIGAGVTQTAVHMLDLESGAWTVAADMATPRRHFALMLGGDDYLWAVGGDNDAGGTDAVERLFTPRCPGFARQPGDLVAWSGTLAAFSVEPTGAAPFTFQWRRDGVELTNGPAAGGGTISGATEAALVITAPTDADEGAYDCVVGNACGSTASAAGALTVQPTPSLPAQWSVTNLHPGWAQSSSVANAIADGAIGGSASTPTLLPDGRTLTLSHPVLWSGPPWTAVDLTPPGSAGGAVLDMTGDYAVGWFWHLYSCPVGGQSSTCGWESAAYWAGDPPVFDEVHISGAEYDHVVATDGQGMVGTVTFEYTEGNYSHRAYLWTPPAYGVSLHPAGVSASGASAVDGGRQYGSISTAYPDPTTRAAMWSGSAATYVDIHPAGFSRSWVTGAGDGQAVGTAFVGDSSHAVMWVGAAAVVIDLTPPGMGANVTNAAHGLQVGQAGGHAAVWAGSAASMLDLGVMLPPEYAGSSARDVEIAPDGTITVVGSAYVPSRSRTEALLWRSVNGTAGDANGDGAVDVDDLIAVITGWGPCPAPPAPCAADLDGNGAVDVDDLLIVIIGWSAG